MTVIRAINKLAITGNAVPYWIMKTAISAGWTVPRSGSGVSGVFDTADVFNQVLPNTEISVGTNVGIGSGSEAMGNRRCWYVLKTPTGGREFLIYRSSVQTDAGDSKWHARYSKAAGFTGGDEDTIPSATDEEHLRVGAGDPIDLANIFRQGNQSSVIHIAVDDTADSWGEYGLLALEMIPGDSPKNDAGAIFMIDNMALAATGDPHTIVMTMMTLGDGLVLNRLFSSYGTDRPRSWGNEGLGGEAWCACHYTSWEFNSAHFHLSGSNDRSDYGETTLDIPIVGASSVGRMGVSRWLRWPSLSKGYPHLNNDKTIVFCGDYAIADLWDGVSVPHMVVD
jgi:hypothetical protein